MQLRWLRQPLRHLVVLVLGAGIAGLLLAAASDGSALSPLDGGAAAAVSLHGSSALDGVMLGITSAGEEIVLGILFLALTLFAYRTRGRTWGRFFATAGAGALVLDNLIKVMVGRPRPVLDQLVAGRGSSFPSGHVVATTVLLFALAFFVSRGRGAAARRAMWASAASGSILMGLSRIYVGVHWPTDVIAGGLIGGTWTLLCVRALAAQPAVAVPRRRSGLPLRSRLAPAATVLALAGVACSGPTPDNATPIEATSPTKARAYDPNIDPTNFVGRIDNRFFPLIPGTVFRLRGATEDGIERETITVTHDTREVMGVTTTVIKDVVRVDDEVAESTHDWYAQDRKGNVWYFGEDTAEYANGKVVNHHGSWEAGIDGALPGIIMSADPQVLDSYRQEYYEGEAEDMFWVVGTGETLSVPLGEFHDVVRVLEFNPLEPKIIVEKRYAPGMGLLAEEALSGGKEVVRLLEVIGP